MNNTLFRKFVLTHKQYLSTSLVSFSVKGTIEDFIPGQYLIFRWQDDVLRAYSISNEVIIGQESSLSFYVTIRGGLGSNYLRNINIGDSVLAYGPQGEFHLKKTPAHSRHIMITTGTGLSPVLSMLPTISCLPDQSFIIVNYAHSIDDLIESSKLIKLSQEQTNLDYLALIDHKLYYSSHERFINMQQNKLTIQQILHYIKIDRHNDTLYLCGNPNMVNEQTLANENKCLNIITEAFG